MGEPSQRSHRQAPCQHSSTCPECPAPHPTRTSRHTRSVRPSHHSAHTDKRHASATRHAPSARRLTPPELHDTPGVFGLAITALTPTSAMPAPLDMPRVPGASPHQNFTTHPECPQLVFDCGLDPGDGGEFVPCLAVEQVGDGLGVDAGSLRDGVDRGAPSPPQSLLESLSEFLGEPKLKSSPVDSITARSCWLDPSSLLLRRGW